MKEMYNKRDRQLHSLPHYIIPYAPYPPFPSRAVKSGVNSAIRARLKAQTEDEMAKKGQALMKKVDSK